MTLFEVLIAELMLQKTAAEQVRDVFGDFVRRYPNPESIAAASEEAIAEEIEPLGLRKRAGYLKRTSEQIIERHGGDVPDARSELLDLHGVGEYTAAAVLAHAFGKDVAAVDTNVARILSGAFGLDVADDPSAAENWELAERLAPAGRCGDYLHALIDFSAAVCTASDPNCESCPLEDSCQYPTDEGLHGSGNALRRRRYHLASESLIAETAFDPDSYEPRLLHAGLDAGRYPDAVTAARLDNRWFTTGDFSIHYVEDHDEGNQWECRWDRHLNTHNTRLHFHQPPSATEITDLELPSLHPLDVYSTVLAAIEQRLKTLWASQ